MLRVYYANIDSVPESPDGLPLSSYRLDKLSSCRLPHSRRQGIGAELLLIRSLQKSGIDVQPPLSLSAGKNGKPYLSGSDLYFSLSHSGSFAACAICDCPVGVDIERGGRLSEPVLRRCFSPAEQMQVHSSADPDHLFTFYWTGKESYVKAIGEGIRFPLREIVPLDPPANVSFFQTVLDSYCLSVCVLHGIADPDTLELIVLPA